MFCCSVLRSALSGREKYFFYMAAHRRSTFFFIWVLRYRLSFHFYSKSINSWSGFSDDKIGQTYKPSLSLLEQLSDLMLVFLMVRSSSWELVYHLFGRVPKVGPWEENMLLELTSQLWIQRNSLVSWSPLDPFLRWALSFLEAPDKDKNSNASKKDDRQSVTRDYMPVFLWAGHEF